VKQFADVPVGKRLAVLEYQASNFNARMPVGTPVVLKTPQGEVVRTKVRTAAAIIGAPDNMQIRVWLEGVPSSWDISLVTKDNEAIAAGAF